MSFEDAQKDFARSSGKFSTVLSILVSMIRFRCFVVTGKI